jgi:outer membrane protein assembly factor BamB
MNARQTLLLPLILGILALLTLAADWPQWRGPQRNGISPETGLLKEWPKEGPKLLWQVHDIGDGYSTPSVVGERIYLLSNKGMDNEFVQALDVKDGKQVWAAQIGKVGPNFGQPYPAARSTPTVEGDVLYALGSDGDLACLETAGGKIRWHKNLRKEFGGQPGMWAYSESPLIDGEKLVCTPGGSEATMVALNKTNGELIWKMPFPGGSQAAYASPLVMEAGGVKQYIQFLQKGLVGVEAKSGKMLWQYEKTAKGSPAVIPTPVVHDHFVYSGAARVGGGLVELKADDKGFQTHQVYFAANLPTAIGGAVRIGDYLYGTTSQALVCVEFKTGNIKWSDRCVGPASLCYADGRLYVHGENGDLALVDASPDGYHLRGRFKPPGQPTRGKSKAWAYPIIANGRLYIRDLGVLWCYDVKGL